MMPRRGVTLRPSFHYGWVVVAVTALVMLLASGFRSGAGLFINPLEAEFGWSRAAISSAIGLNLLLFGVFAPVAGRLIDTQGPRRVMAFSLLLLAVSMGGAVWMKTIWHFTLLWGTMVGVGISGLASVMTAAVANRWFVARRGLVVGVLNSASSGGQVAVLPLLMVVIVQAGWRQASLLMAVGMLALLPVVWVLMRDDPADMGLAAYGAAEAQVAAATVAPQPRPGPVAGPTAGPAGAPADLATPVTLAARHPAFWILAGTFFVCGLTSSGLIGTHLIPFAVDRGISEVTAATTLGIMGVMNFAGTILSGWLTDRINPRLILALAYTLRGLALLVLPFVRTDAGLFAFAFVYGLDWMATVPPTVTLSADLFGKRSVATIFGWVFLSHQVGAALAATGGGTLRVWLGDYHAALLLAGALALVGGGLSLLVPTPGRRVTPVAAGS